jgi:uncharacterized protein YdcH (DUF465 family)
METKTLELQMSIRNIIGLLEEFRLSGSIKDYRTTADSLYILNNMYSKEVHKSYQEIDRHIVFSETTNPFLEVELKELKKQMNEFINKKDVRNYREVLLSFEKITEAKNKLDAAIQYVQSSIMRVKNNIK